MSLVKSSVDHNISLFYEEFLWMNVLFHATFDVS